MGTKYPTHKIHTHTRAQDACRIVFPQCFVLQPLPPGSCGSQSRHARTHKPSNTYTLSNTHTTHTSSSPEKSWHTYARQLPLATHNTHNTHTHIHTLSYTLPILPTLHPNTRTHTYTHTLTALAKLHDCCSCEEDFTRFSVSSVRSYITYVHNMKTGFHYSAMYTHRTFP